ncbi:MAG: hypothetical protein ACXABY_00030 [Candidatus Thorarchaeota archaeon]|jgi:hypothetical protein
MPGQNIIKRFLNEAMKGLSEGSTIFEAGTGKSTIYLLELAWTTRSKLVTVDINHDAIHNVEKLLNDYPLIAGSKAVNMRAEDYLKEHQEKNISLAYIDAYDYNHGRLNPRKIDFYRKMNLPLNKESCWEAHLRIAEELQKKMHSGGHICIDDVYDHKWEGKGLLAIPYLLEEKRYQVIAYSKVDRSILLRAP